MCYFYSIINTLKARHDLLGVCFEVFIEIHPPSFSPSHETPIFWEMVKISDATKLISFGHINMSWISAIYLDFKIVGRGNSYPFCVCIQGGTEPSYVCSHLLLKKLRDGSAACTFFPIGSLQIPHVPMVYHDYEYFSR